ncbi:hypothetical protein K435DRAFT_793225 [Dendrothele bispora CBS 962.96]|uniref:Uncharacterized protein n=1 Tax=Dendrothele bispora (strain CBS 962.96) TaxID=1314807 RepID=A0A4S8MG68_DENBC|nr:hypothetical protein K435DRAFT_793225 [Dendrothele bispora CBS 962.96]
MFKVSFLFLAWSRCYRMRFQFNPLRVSPLCHSSACIFMNAGFVQKLLQHLNSPLSVLSVDTLRTERSTTRTGFNPSSHGCCTDNHSPDLCYPVDSSPRVDNPSNELEQIIQQEKNLLIDFNRLKQDYDKLRLQVDGEIHNLTTANNALNQIVLAIKKELEGISNLAVKGFRGNITRVETEILNHARVLGSAMSAAHYSVLHDDLQVIQDRLKAVGMAYDTLTTFLNQAFNSSRAVTGFASEDIPGIETFLRSTPAPIPVAIKPFTTPPVASSNAAVLAGVHVGPPSSLFTATAQAGPSRLIHPLPPRPESSVNTGGVQRTRRRRNRFLRNSSAPNSYQGQTQNYDDN